MFGLGKKKIELYPVFEGRVVSFDDVPDEMFQQRMLGEGYAVVPNEVETLDVLAPVDGTVSKTFKALHAFAIQLRALTYWFTLVWELLSLEGRALNSSSQRAQALRLENRLFSRRRGSRAGKTW